MCYKHDLKTDFRWRSIEDEEDPCWDHTYLVSDGNVIGLCGYTLQDGKGIWELAYEDKIRTITYYGGDVSYADGRESKQYMDISEIKYWCPIPSLSL